MFLGVQQVTQLRRVLIPSRRDCFPQECALSLQLLLPLSNNVQVACQQTAVHDPRSPPGDHYPPGGNGELLCMLWLLFTCVYCENVKSFFSHPEIFLNQLGAHLTFWIGLSRPAAGGSWTWTDGRHLGTTWVFNTWFEHIPYLWNCMTIITHMALT